MAVRNCLWLPRCTKCPQGRARARGNGAKSCRRRWELGECSRLRANEAKAAQIPLEIRVAALVASREQRIAAEGRNENAPNGQGVWVSEDGPERLGVGNPRSGDGRGERGKVRGSAARKAVAQRGGDGVIRGDVRGGRGHGGRRLWGRGWEEG